MVVAASWNATSLRSVAAAPLTDAYRAAVFRYQTALRVSRPARIRSNRPSASKIHGLQVVGLWPWSVSDRRPVNSPRPSFRVHPPASRQGGHRHIRPPSPSKSPTASACGSRNSPSIRASSRAGPPTQNTPVPVPQLATTSDAIPIHPPPGLVCPPARGAIRLLSSRAPLRTSPVPHHVNIAAPRPGSPPTGRDAHPRSRSATSSNGPSVRSRQVMM